MTDRLLELKVFTRAAERGSFSRAGRELNLSQPSISRIIGELEGRLGVKLLHRTTRRICLTDAGIVFLDRARQILAKLEDAEDVVRGVDVLRGNIRLALPVLYGTLKIVPLLPEFLKRHPLLGVEMKFSDERQNLVAEGADIAIRLGALDDTASGARKLETLERYLIASPGYLETHGTPMTPADLSAHECIFGPGAFGRDIWMFQHNDAITAVDVQGRIHTDSGSGVFAALMAGLGIAMVSSVMCTAQLASGDLVRLLPEYALDPVDVHAIFPGGPRPSNKVLSFVDYLMEELSRNA